jgi:hypothetical protein
MNLKTNRNQQRVARKLARELTHSPRRPGFLVRLCHWEELCRRHEFFTPQYRRD